MVRKSFIVAASVLALAGCGESDGTNKGNDTVPSANALPGTGSSVSIQPGQWEVVTETVKFDAPNMPKQILEKMMSNRNRTNKICITAEDLQRTSGSIFTGKKDENCSKQEFTLAGGRVKGHMVCSGGQAPGQMELEMEGTYTSTTYTTNSKMQMTGEGMAMHIESRATARRIGDCSPGSED